MAAGLRGAAALELAEGVEPIGVEGFVLAYILRRGGVVSVSELEAAVSRAARMGLLRGVDGEAAALDRLTDYLRYLTRIRVVDLEDGKVRLREDRISPALRRALERTAYRVVELVLGGVEP